MLPTHYVTLWYSDNQIRMHIPPSPDGTHGHSLTFSDDLQGWARIKTLLRDRAKAKDLRIALRGTPTQAQLPQYDEKQVRRPKPKVKIPADVEASSREFMRKMGLI